MSININIVYVFTLDALNGHSVPREYLNKKKNITTLTEIFRFITNTKAMTGEIMSVMATDVLLTVL